MSQNCALCRAKGDKPSEAFSVCSACARRLSDATDMAAIRDVLDTYHKPVLLMQANPRQVVTGNAKALELFGKDLPQVEAHRGGEVFNCLHSFTPAGCGMDQNCEHCRIKKHVVDTFTTGSGFAGISTPLEIVKGDDVLTYQMQVSTANAGDYLLLRIERFSQA